MLCHSFPTLHFPTDWAMTTSRHIWPLWALTMALGCGKPEAAGTLINMYDNQFSGAVARVPVGTRVTFLNGGRSVHNATAVDGAWKSTRCATGRDELPLLDCRLHVRADR